MCVISLFFTGAKVNFIKPIKFILIIYMLRIWQLNRNFSISSFFYVIIILTIPVTLLVSFMVYSGDKGSVGVALQNIALRFSAQIATLEAVLQSESPYYSGLLTFLPVSKVLAVLGMIDHAPRHILPFYNVPFAWNVATYLEVGYRDFGLLGIIFIQVYFGIFLSFVLWWCRFMKSRSLILVIFILMTNFCFSATSIAPVIKPIYWFQILLILSLDLAIRVKLKRRKFL